MPYTIKKRKCKQSDGDTGSYVLSYTDKKGKKHSACHTSKKKAQGQIAAIEMPRESDNIKEDIIPAQKTIKLTREQLRQLIHEVTIQDVEVTPIRGKIQFAWPDTGHEPAIYKLKATDVGVPGVSSAKIHVKNLSYSGGDLTVDAEASTTVAGIKIKRKIIDTIKSDVVKNIISKVNAGHETFSFTGKQGKITGRLVESLVKRIIKEELSMLAEQVNPQERYDRREKQSSLTPQQGGQQELSQVKHDMALDTLKGRLKSSA